MRPAYRAALRQRYTPAPLALAATVAIALATGHAPLAHAQSGAATAAASPIAINIPTQPLGQALNELARQANLQMTFPAALVAGKQAPAVSGQFTIRQALDRLLAGSGLNATTQGTNVVIQLARAPAAAGAEPVLPTVTVSASSEQPLQARQERGFRAKSSSASGFREQEVLNTPFSTTTITAEVIADQQAKSLIDVIKNDPSVVPADNPLFYDRVNVRGFYLSTDAVFRDGLPINDQGSIALDNKAAVEVNKGLSALRYGATSPGGTVNYVVKRPTDEPLRKVTIGGDNNGGYGAAVDLGGRFGNEGQFGYRINAATEEMGSHVNAFKGDKQFVSGFFDWIVNDKLTLELDLEHQRMKKLSVGTPYLFWWGFSEDAAAVAAAQAAFPRLTPEIYISQPWAVEPNEQTYAVARANYQINDVWKASFAAHNSSLKRDQNSGGLFDVVDANGEYEASIYYAPKQERNNRAYQLVFQGDVDQGSMRHEIALGADHVQRDFRGVGEIYDPIGFDNIFDPRGLPRPAVGLGNFGPSYLTGRTRQQSFFVTDNLIISDQWRVFAGLRHTNIQQFNAASAADALQKRYDKSKLNPTLGLIYKPAPQGTVYVSYAEGIEQGGIVNGATYTNNGEQLAPLTSQQVEAGVKWEIGGDALVTAALFQIDKGLEIDRDNGNGTRTRVQDGRQVHRGLEFTASGRVSPQLRLLAGLAFTDPEIQKTSNAALVGKKPQGVPDWQANLYADYTLSAWVPGLSASGGIYFGGRKAIDPGNLWFSDSYVRVDVGVKYVQRMSGGQEATYRLNVDNLTDKAYLTNTTFGALQFGAPRTLRLSASYSF